MATLNFYIAPSADKVLIMASFENRGKRVRKSTGFKIEKKNWDKNKQRAKGSDSVAINAKLSAWESRFDNYLKECLSAEQEPDITRYVAGIDKRGKNNTGLLAIAKEYADYLREVTKDRNYKQADTLVTQLTSFQEYRGKTIALSEVGEGFFTEYGLYLINQEKNINNTVRRKLSRLGSLVNYAVRKKYMPPVALDKHPFKGTPSSKVSLLPAEIEILAQLDLHDHYQKRVRDAFILACLTGLRHSDIILITPANFKTMHGIRVIDLTQFKGTKQNTVPITEEAYTLASGYFGKPTQPLFPFSHSQAWSRTLKDIFKAAKLDRPCEVITARNSTIERSTKPLHDIISFHCGRNTYITSLLAKGVPAVYVKDNAGHADIRTTMGYSKQDDLLRWKETLRVMGG